MFTTIIFDFFDVIRVDPYKKWLGDHGYVRDGFWYDIAAQYDRGLITRETFIEELARESGQDSKDVDLSFKNASQFDHDVIAIIRQLNSSHQTALLSNSGGPGLRRLLDEEALDSIFHEIIISGEVGFIKPEPEIFQIALERLDAESGKTIFIDDNQHNIDGAEKVGIKGILFTGVLKLKMDLEEFGVSVA